MKSKSVLALVDWDTSRRFFKPSKVMRKELISEKRMLSLKDAIGKGLKCRFGSFRYSVKLRLYHGWHRGKTPTDDRREIEGAGKFLVDGIGHVAFDRNIGFGNELLCGGRRACLYDTLRTREGGDRSEQKMVDTAIVSDILYCVRSNDYDIVLVVGSDDDLLPGVITAEAWGRFGVLYVTPRGNVNRFNVVDGLYYNYSEGE